MQLVLSNNRVIAHGENFLSMGGVVINTETGKRYENATVAECNGCPSDIDQVGYEYHAGVFVPCAPYGKGEGKGYVMEVCPDCATPRNSGVSMDVLKWTTLSEVVFSKNYAGSGSSDTQTIEFPVNDFSDYVEFRVVIKEGTIKWGSDADTTFRIGTADETWLTQEVTGNAQIDYTDRAIYRERKADADKSVTTRMQIKASSYSYGDSIAMTFELQGRKE